MDPGSGGGQNKVSATPPRLPLSSLDRPAVRESVEDCPWCPLRRGPDAQGHSGLLLTLCLGQGSLVCWFAPEPPGEVDAAPERRGAALSWECRSCASSSSGRGHGRSWQGLLCLLRTSLRFGTDSEDGTYSVLSRISLPVPVHKHTFFPFTRDTMTLQGLPTIHTSSSLVREGFI